MSDIRNVIIVGAGGHLGPSVLAAFVNDSHFNVSVLTRHSSTSTFPDNVKIHRISDEYPEFELLQALKGQDAIISTIATANARMQKALIDAAIKSGVKRFVPSEFGGDTRNKKTLSLIPQYFQGKVDTIEYLKENEKEGLTWTAFVTGCFFELAVQVFMGFDIGKKQALILNDGNVRWSTTTMPTIGLAIKNSFLTPEKTANQYLFIDSFTVTSMEVMASLERATGGKWNATHVEAEEQKMMALEKVSKGDMTGFMTLIRYINSVEGYGADYHPEHESGNDLLSLPQEDLDETIVRIVNT